MRWAMRILAGLAVLAAVLGMWGYRNARADPVVRYARIAMPDWPAGAKPVRLALISDIHLGNRVMDVARLKRIARQLAALQPDLVVIAGDFVAGHDPADNARSAALLGDALAVLRPPLGMLAVRGNHDNWDSARGVHAALARARIGVLENAAARRGPLSIGGLSDMTRRPHLANTVAAMRALPGARVMIGHESDYAAIMPADVSLFLGGHAHCGQVIIPGFGPAKRPVTDPRYLCGLVRDPGRVSVITGGLGTSVVPLRVGAPPDLWLLTLGPRSAAARRAR